MDIGQMGGGDALYTRIYQVQMRIISSVTRTILDLAGNLLLQSSPLLPLPKVARLGLLHQGDPAGGPAQKANLACDDGKDTLAATWTPGHDTCTTCLY